MGENGFRSPLFAAMRESLAVEFGFVLRHLHRFRGEFREDLRFQYAKHWVTSEQGTQSEGLRLPGRGADPGHCQPFHGDEKTQ